MSWILLSLLSALLLGLYEIANKYSLHENAVLPVLFFSTTASALFFGTLITAGHFFQLPPSLQIPSLSFHQHLLIFLKALIVASSWLCTYFALKKLPVTIAAPVRATGPLWTLFGAIFILGEAPSFLETIGILTTLGSFFGLSLAGGKEGIHFHKNPFIWLTIAGTLIGSVSGLYDKYLMSSAGFTPPGILAWYFIYIALVFAPLMLGWQRRWWPRHEFHWRHTILLLALFLVISDYLYFAALGNTDSMIAVVASLRRGSTLVAFLGGIWLLKEANALQKLPAVLGILLGIILTILG